MYHDSRDKTIIGFECSYYGDYRNPSGNKDEVLTANNLVKMGYKDQSGFNRDRNYWN